MLAKKLLEAAGNSTQPVYVEDCFSTYLYTGNGSTQTINNGIDLSGKGGLTWIKVRDYADSHRLFDTTRGVGKYLTTNGTFAETTNSASVTAFNSNGFSLGSFAGTNGTAFGSNYASWTFRKQPKFFDVVTFVKDSSTNQRISHSLDSVPACIIVKRVTSADDWYVYHRSLGGLNKWISLNSTGAVSTTSGAWGSSDPTTTDFGVSTNLLYDGGGTPLTYVAYVFAHNAGGFGLTGTDNVISCGSFTATTGAVYRDVNLGYEPQWVLVKEASNAGTWQITDNMRGMTSNSDIGIATGNILQPDSSAAEFNNPIIQTSATGFTYYGNAYSSGANVIYIAIRRGPMKVPTDATKVYSAAYGTSGSPSLIAGFPVDSGLMTEPSVGGSERFWSSRLTGAGNYLKPYSTAAETSGQSNLTYDWMNGTWNSGLGGGYFSWNWRRAPSFFDEVCYTGTGSATTQTHNLGAVPELMIVKRRDGTSYGDWLVYHSALGNTKYLLLNTNDASATANSGAWNYTNPTSTQFTVGDWESLTSTATYVAYLFATCAGVSKCTAFTGTGTLQTINCGFTSGARFVLIKRTDSTGDWYVWDSSRGLSSSTDPYLLLNSTAAEVTSTNWVDTTSTGFQVTAASGNNVNISGASYIALAIA